MADVILNGAELAKLLRSPAGAVGRDVIRRANRVRARAKQLVGKKSRKLEHSIVVRPAMRGREFECKIGSFGAVGYDLYHHEGTGPHEIRPRNARVLSFMGSDGTQVFAAVVQHPGTPANKYLSGALSAAR